MADDDFDDMDVEDEMLQQALALSLQAAQQQGPPASSANPPAGSALLNSYVAPQLPQAPQPQQAQHQPVTAQSLAAILAAATASLAQPGQAPVLWAPAPAPSAPPVQRNIVPAPARRPATGAAAVPHWTEQARVWLTRPPEWYAARQALLEAGAAPIPAEQEADLSAALAKALGTPVVLVAPGRQAPPHDPAAATLHLNPKRSLPVAAIDAALSFRCQPRFTAGASKLQCLHDCWLATRTLLSATVAQPTQAVLRVVQTRAAQAAHKLLGEDDDDLFFEGAQHAAQFVRGLGEGRLQAGWVEDLVEQAVTEADARLWEAVLGRAFGALRGLRLLDAMAAGAHLHALDALTAPLLLQRALASLLVREALAAARWTGRQLEAQSLLAPLLAVSVFPDVAAARSGRVNSGACEYFTSLRRYPDNRGEVDGAISFIRRTIDSCNSAAHEICKRLAKLKGVQPEALGREAVLGWLAGAAGSSEVRTAGGEDKGVLAHPAALLQGTSDDFALGAVALGLRFCRPFLAGEAKHLAHLDPAFYAAQRHRVAAALGEGTLAGRDQDASSTSASVPYVAPDRPATQAPHFIAECFFLTQRLVHCGLLPAVNRYRQLADLLSRAPGGEGGEEGRPPGGRSREAALLDDCAAALLLNPELAAPAVQFCALQAKWLLALMARGEEQAAAAFRHIPESVVKDLASWLSFVISMGEAQLLGGVNMAELVAALTALLQSPRLVPSTLVQAKIVQLLLTMLAPTMDPRRRLGAGMLGPTHLRPGEGALIAAVLGSGAAQRDLVPALMRVYAAADNVVGLDVDRDTFDKFGLRNWIDLILLELWKDAGCARSLTALAQAAQAQGPGAPFTDYAAAVLNSLLYLLRDVIDRLYDINAIEEAKADEAAWAALPPETRQAKEAFLGGQRRTAGGFLRMARVTLALLNTLAADPAIQPTFLKAPLVGRAAYALVHFSELLVGPRSAALRVANPGQYGWDRPRLLRDLCDGLLRLAGHAAFAAALAAEPDYEEEVFRKAHAVLAADQMGSYEQTARLEALMAQVAAVRGAGASGPAAALRPADADGVLELPDLSFGEPEVADLPAAYEAAMQPLTVGDFDATADNAYNRAFADMATAAAGDTAAKMRRLTRELRALRGNQPLPAHAAAAIFLRHDAERIDKMRALITGPEGTPYAFGCFIFDIFCPPDYPNVPPLMNMETTGGGRVRLNPNLYADGKVCLSLLGTWHGGSASEKWNPASSSLWQALISIQSMILISDPYFNEPNVETMRGQKEGDTHSAQYNAEIVLHALRWAMKDPLTRLRPGFEDVTRQHFRLQRHALMRQCRKWYDDFSFEGPTYRRRLREEIVQLHVILAKL